MSVEADIAPIAALRGKPVANYIAEAKRLETEGRRISAAEINDLFRMGDDRKREMDEYDHLPSRSRTVLAEAPICPSALKYAMLLGRCRNEGFLIDAVRDCLPGIVRNWVLDHFDPTHPSARKLA